MLYDKIMEAVENSLHSPFDWKNDNIRSRLDQLTMLCYDTLNSKEIPQIDYAYVNNAVTELSYFPHAAARVYELFHLYEICSIKNRFGSLEGHYTREQEREREREKQFTMM